MIITDRLVQEFVWDKLSYKESVFVIGWKRYDNFIHIMFDMGGETVPISKYNEWLIEKRNDKIESILLD